MTKFFLRIVGPVIALTFATWVAVAAPASAPLPAAAQEVHRFNVAAPDAASAIRSFGAQSNIQILASAEDLAGKKFNAVQGDMPIEQGLNALLEGTGLGHRYVSDRAVALVSAPNAGGTPTETSAAKTVVKFDIPAQGLDAALKDFSAQSGLPITAAKELTAGKKSKGARGTMKVSEALRRVLKGTELTFVLGSDGGYAIQALLSEAPNQEKADAADVTVEGQQQKEKPYSGMNVDIPRTIDDVQPYYIFDSATIEQSAAINVEDFLKQRLTMNTSYSNASQAYGALGVPGAQPGSAVPGATTSSINLRGLGANETLILVDGRRMAGVTVVNSAQGSISSTQPDVNGIPLAAIDRIEVLPSSASGIYGGSAIGGVINIILKKNYQGGELRVGYEKPSHSSASTPSVDGTYGFSLEDGKTHVMLSAHYSDAEPLVTSDRAFLIERGINTILKNCPTCLYGVGQAFPGGSTPNLAGLDVNDNPSNLILTNGLNLGTPYAHIAPGCSSKSPLATCLLPGFNFNLSPGYGPYGLEQPLGSFATVTSFDATVNRQMASWITAFAEVKLSENVGRTQFNGFNGGYLEGPGNGLPVVGDPFQNTYVGYSSPATFAAEARAFSATRTATMGATLTLPHGWNGEMDYTWTKNEFSTQSGYGFNSSAYNLAVQNGLIDPLVDTLRFPLNLSQFNEPQAIDSSSVTNDVAMRGTGPVFPLPAGNATLAFGLDYEWDKTPGATANNPQPPNPDTETIYLPQTQSNTSLYVEGTLPLISAKNATWGVQSLELQLADRIQHYSVLAGTTVEYVSPVTTFSGVSYPSYVFYSPTPPTAGPCPAFVGGNYCGGTAYRYGTSYSSNNDTIGLKYKPIDELTFRISRASAFLPPSNSQLLPNPIVQINGDSITDPKTGQTYQVNTITGGNPNLRPQSSKSWDLGLIFEPQEEALKGLRVDLEYYKISQLNYITGISGNQVVNSPAFASRITRNAAGVITLINESEVNAPLFKTEGWDLSVNYRKSTALGTFDWSAAVTKIQLEDRQYSVGGPTADYVGWADDGGEGKYKGNGTFTWTYQHLMLGWATTWYGRYAVNATLGDPTYAGSGLTEYIGPGSPFAQQGSDHIPSQIYHQLMASYALGKDSTTWRGAFSNLTFQLVVKNVFNTLPPFDAVILPFYYSPYGDINLRTYDLSFRKSF